MDNKKRIGDLGLNARELEYCQRVINDYLNVSMIHNSDDMTMVISDDLLAFTVNGEYIAEPFKRYADEVYDLAKALKEVRRANSSR